MAMVGLSLVLFGFGGAFSAALGVALGDVRIGAAVHGVATILLLDRSLRAAGSVENWLRRRMPGRYGLPAPAVVWVGMVFAVVGIACFGPMKFDGLPPPAGVAEYLGISMLCLGTGISLMVLDDCCRGEMLWTGLPSFRPFGFFRRGAMPAWCRLAFGNVYAQFCGVWIAGWSGEVMLGLGVHVFVWGPAFRTELPHAELRPPRRRGGKPPEPPARAGGWGDRFDPLVWAAATVGGGWMFVEFCRGGVPGRFGSPGVDAYAMSLLPVGGATWFLISLRNLAGPISFDPSTASPDYFADRTNRAENLRGWARVLLCGGGAGLAASWIAVYGGGWIGAGLAWAGGWAFGLLACRRPSGSFAARLDSARTPAARFHPLERVFGRFPAFVLSATAFALPATIVCLHVTRQPIPAGAAEIPGLSLGLLGLGDLALSCAVQCRPPRGADASRSTGRSRRRTRPRPGPLPL